MARYLFLLISFLIYNYFDIVVCEGNSLPKSEVENCRDVCRKNFRIRIELKACIEKCDPRPTHLNEGAVVETCIKECVRQNPDGQGLCALKCRSNVPLDQQQTPSVADKHVVRDEIEVPEENVFDVFERIHSRVSKMMECLMDGMKHQVRYGWSGSPDMMDSRVGKFLGDAEEFFGDRPSEIPPVKGPLLSNTNHVLPSNGLVGGKEDHGAIVEDMPPYRPILHRLVIIRKIPPFSLEENEEAEQASDLAMADNMAERLKNLFSNFFDDSVPIADGIHQVKVNEIKNLKSVKMEGETYILKKESSGKFCDFLASLAHKSGLKRTTFILVMAIVLLCFAWYCIATILSHKHNKEVIQGQGGKAIHEDLEYLVPIEEKFIFFAHLGEKEKVEEVVQAPNIPIKIKIQDV